MGGKKAYKAGRKQGIQDHGGLVTRAHHEQLFNKPPLPTRPPTKDLNEVDLKLEDKREFKKGQKDGFEAARRGYRRANPEVNLPASLTAPLDTVESDTGNHLQNFQVIAALVSLYLGLIAVLPEAKPAIRGLFSRHKNQDQDQDQNPDQDNTN